MDISVLRGRSIGNNHRLRRAPRPPSRWACAFLGVYHPPPRFFGSNCRLGMTLRPPSGGPAPGGLLVPCKRSLGSDRRLGKPLTPSRWLARTDGGRRPPRALSKTSTTALQGLPLPPAGGVAPMGAAVPHRRSLGSNRLMGRTPRPPGWWASANVGCQPPQAPFGQRPPPRRDSLPPRLEEPHLGGLPSPRRRSFGSDRLLGESRYVPSW